MFLRFFSVVSFMPAHDRAYYALAYTVKSGTLVIPDDTVNVNDHAALFIALNPELSLVGFDVNCDHALRILPMPTITVDRPYAASWITRVWRSAVAPVWHKLPDGTVRLVYRSLLTANRPPVLRRDTSLNVIRIARRRVSRIKPYNLE